MQDFGDASGAATHMNIDHADSLLAFAHHYLPREMGVNRAEMTDATPEGIHMRVFTKKRQRGGEKSFYPVSRGPQRQPRGVLKKSNRCHARRGARRARQALSAAVLRSETAVPLRDFRLPRPHHDPYHS